MLELIATLVVDLSDQQLTVYDRNEQVVRVIPVSTGKASTPTPTGHASVLTKYRSVTMRGRDYVAPGVPYAMCITANEAICMHGAPWQEDAGQAFGVPRSHGCVRMPTHEARWLFENTPKGTKVIIQV
jgi:lipoprotein-anchoring transpeptidase ErfK/SrfK